MHRVLRLVAPVLVVVALAGGAQALGAVPTFHDGLSKAQILRAAKASNRVIVVLKAQQKGQLASASSVKARSAGQRRQRRPLIARIAASGGSLTRQYTTLNAFGATVSSGLQKRLEADPTVAAVIPDAVVTPVQAPATIGQNNRSRRPAGHPRATRRRRRRGSARPTRPSRCSSPRRCRRCTSPTTTPRSRRPRTWPRARASRSRSSPTAWTSTTPTSSVRTARTSSSTTATSPARARTRRHRRAEAFGDASSIAAQGRQVYDLSTFVNPAHPLPPGCNIRVRGVAPGASLIGMKVFGEGGSFTSVIIQGMDWAVTHDHADILSESFGGYAMPDTALDAVKLFNDAAVRSGVTVSQGTSDSGATEGPTSPAHRPARDRRRRAARTSAPTRRPRRMRSSSRTANAG